MKKYINMILTVIISISALSGIWLIASPALEKQEALSQQNKLIASIEANTVIPSQILETDISSENIALLEEIISEHISEPDLNYITLEVIPVDIGAELGIIIIDKINLKLPIVEGVETQTLKIAVGHVPETPPVGKIGNAVIAGHRNYTYGSMFNRLGEIEIGDIIDYAPINGEPMQFRVFEIVEIEPDDQIAFIQPDNEAIITLYTCTPIVEATHRLLVRAVKI